MNILIVSDLYLPHVGGILRYIQRISKEFLLNGNKVAYIVPSVSFFPKVEVVNNVKVYSFYSLPMPFYPDIHMALPYQNGAIGKALDEFKPDVVHVHTNLAIARTVLAEAKKRNIPTVGTNHFMSENLLPKLPLTPKLKLSLDRKVWKNLSAFFEKFDAVTTPSNWAADYLKKKGIKNKIYAISNGIDFSVFNKRNADKVTYLAKKYHLPKSGEILLYVGRIDKEKNIEVILRAMQKLEKSKQVYLILVGKGTELKTLKSEAKNMGLANKIIITGFVDDQHLPIFYCYADAFVISSIAELQSIVTLEAMASGLPVVASDAGALPELVKAGVNGFLFSPDDSSELSLMLEKIITNPKLKAGMGQASIDIARKHDIKLIVRQFENLYGQTRSLHL